MRLFGIARFTAVAAAVVLAFAPAALAAMAPTSAGDTPEPLMRKIMASYRDSAKGSSAAIGQNYFDPALTKLDRDNGRLFDGVDVLDGDPVCQCQDVGGTYKWTGHSEGRDRWVAVVSRSDMKTPWQVIWKRIGNRWGIYDVIDETGSIRGLLERHNRCAREKLAHHQKTDACAELK
ncbi:MAG TPA: hypothetical protein VG407_01085 [Caulobacteraceae bacterium]|jgi:hypothetical protein|nr:hypothetical protein [Caulobacteraceae bacterium]